MKKYRLLALCQVGGVVRAAHEVVEVDDDWKVPTRVVLAPGGSHDSQSGVGLKDEPIAIEVK